MQIFMLYVTSCSLCLLQRVKLKKYMPQTDADTQRRPFKLHLTSKCVKVEFDLLPFISNIWLHFYPVWFMALKQLNSWRISSILVSNGVEPKWLTTFLYFNRNMNSPKVRRNVHAYSLYNSILECGEGLEMKVDYAAASSCYRSCN